MTIDSPAPSSTTAIRSVSHCHAEGIASPVPSDGQILLVGNPNVGKSAIFSRLTGHYLTVSNYPGTTVELAEGSITVAGDVMTLIDTPGANSLSPRSPDEAVVRDILFTSRPCAVVQVADARNLTRALFLTTQLIELNVPLVLVLNMQDEARARGIKIDVDELSRLLGIDVIPTVATRGEGLSAIPDAVQHARPGNFDTTFDTPLEAAIEHLSNLLPEEISDRRAFALNVLSDTEFSTAIPAEIHVRIAAVQTDLAALYDAPLIYVFNRQRMAAVERLVARVYHKQTDDHLHFADRMGQWAMHPIWGWPILLSIIAGLYLFVGVFGAGTLVDFLETGVFGRWIIPAATTVIDRLLPFLLLQELLIGEYGLLTMALSYALAIVLPIVLTFFFAFSLLEDSGYLPRLSVMVNRPFKVLGLNGKAILPMVLGLGCVTMATLTTRILETRRERLLVTLLLALGVPCSAQLGVILGMIGYLNPAAAAVWAGAVIAVLLAVGWLAARLMPGHPPDFIVELPPLRAPRLDNILFKTLARLEWYLKEVLPLFVLGTLILFILDLIGGLTLIEKMAAPLVEGLLGLPPSTTGAFLIGFLRRDYGAAGLFAMARAGLLDTNQMVVSMVVITLFMPCIASLLMIVREFGARTAAQVTAIVVPLAVAVGSLLNALFGMVRLSW